MAGVAALSAIGTLLSRLTGLGRTIVQGSALGINGVSDAYNLANTTPNIIYDLVLGGILAGTLVPVFVAALADDEERGWEAISAVCTAIAAVLAAITVVFFAAAPLIIRFYTVTSNGAATGDERRIATSLLYMFVPQVALYGLTAVVTAVLAARRSYAVPMYTPILNNVIVIGVLITFAATVSIVTPGAVHHDHGAVLLLGLGTTAGVAAMAVAMLPALRRAGVRLRWVWNPRHPACRRILRLSGWTAGFVVANQVAYLVIILVANHRAGDYSAYSYAYQFFLLPHGIWIVSLLGPMETEMAHRWQAADRDGARRHLVEAIWLGMVLIVPAGLGYAVLARPAIGVVLQHGHVTASGARVTADALAAFAVGLPTFSLYAVMMRSYQAMQDTRSMFKVYAFENTVNIVLALTLYPRFGVRGLAAAWSLAYGAGAAVAVWHQAGRLGGLGGAPLRRAFVRIATGSLFAALAAWAVSTTVGRVAGSSLPALTVRVTAAVGAGVTVYLVAARVLGFRDARHQLQLRRRG
ncbi:MAG: murein biosynthesis integral membrane protein MurJ [Acidimicrobiales bacterium]